MMGLVFLSLPILAYAGKCGSSWKCPASWSTSSTSAPKDAPDARAFIAAHNVYRCMHNVQPVQWDDKVHESAKSSGDDKGSTIENRDSTYPFSKHRGVDATHKWYSEIVEPCQYKKSCFQSDDANHFAAIIWSTVSKAAFTSRKGLSKIAKSDTVAHYETCDGKDRSSGDARKQHVAPPVKDYAACLKEVLACDAFEGLNEEDVDGCDGHSKGEGNVNMVLTMKWTVVYPKKCAAKYANIVDRIRLYNADMPKMPQMNLVNPWQCIAIMNFSGAVLFFVGMAALVIRSTPRQTEVHVSAEAHPLIQVNPSHLEDEQTFCDIEATEIDENLA